MDLLDFGYWDLETQTKHFMIASLMLVIKEYLGSVKLLHCSIVYFPRLDPKRYVYMLDCYSFLI